MLSVSVSVCHVYLCIWLCTSIREGGALTGRTSGDVRLDDDVGVCCACYMYRYLITCLLYCGGYYFLGLWSDVKIVIVILMFTVPVLKVTMNRNLNRPPMH